jgi:acetyl esterase/lipase
VDRHAPGRPRLRRLVRRGFLALGALGLLGACGDDPPEQPERPERPERPVTVAGSQRVDYGDDPAQYAELTVPPADPRGVAVVVHGGFWKPEYGIEYAQPLVPSLVDAGWAVWVTEYRRGAGAADTLDDVLAAIDAVPLDLPAVVGIGHSAGGHLVTWAASTGALTHVVSQAGVLDLRAAYRDDLGEGAVEAFLGHPPGPADDGVDPIRQVPLDVPVWCVHGADDDIVPVTQSRSYVAAARDAGAPAELVEVRGDHFTVIDPDSPAWARTLEILAAL